MAKWLPNRLKAAALYSVLGADQLLMQEPGGETPAPPIRAPKPEVYSANGERARARRRRQIERDIIKSTEEK